MEEASRFPSPPGLEGEQIPRIEYQRRERRFDPSEKLEAIYVGHIARDVSDELLKKVILVSAHSHVYLIQEDSTDVLTRYSI